MHGFMRARDDRGPWKTHILPRRASVATTAHGTTASTSAATA